MKYFLVLFIIYSTPAFCCLDSVPENSLKQQGFYILHTSKSEVLNQCARKSFISDSAWKPTKKQYQIVDKKLQSYLKENEIKLRMLPEKEYHRQYFAYEYKGEKFIYVNVFPASGSSKFFGDSTPVISCEESDDFWGAAFSMKTMKFESIESNKSSQIINKN